MVGDFRSHPGTVRGRLALENRIVMAETFPDLFREAQVHRLASFFRAFRETLLRLSPAAANPSARRAAHPRAA